ncbi:hypothetical protein PF005_g31186, partial [Phytophthora fragariae]
LNGRAQGLHPEMPVQFGSVLLITMGFCGRVVLCQGSCAPVLISVLLSLRVRLCQTLYDLLPHHFCVEARGPWTCAYLLDIA